MKPHIFIKFLIPYVLLIASCLDTDKWQHVAKNCKDLGLDVSFTLKVPPTWKSNPISDSTTVLLFTPEENVTFLVNVFDLRTEEDQDITKIFLLDKETILTSMNNVFAKSGGIYKMLRFENVVVSGINGIAYSALIESNGKYLHTVDYRIVIKDYMIVLYGGVKSNSASTSSFDKYFPTFKAIAKSFKLT